MLTGSKFGIRKVYKSQNIEFELFNFSENILDYFQK